MALGGAVTVNVPDPAVNDIPTRRWSMSNAWVEDPGRTRTAWEMLAASGVDTVNDPPNVTWLGAFAIVGRVAATTLLLASRVKR